MVSQHLNLEGCLCGYKCKCYDVAMIPDLSQLHWKGVCAFHRPSLSFIPPPGAYF